MKPGRTPILDPSRLLVLWSDSGRLTFGEIRKRAMETFPELNQSKNSKYVLLRAVKALVRKRKLKKQKERRSGRSYYYAVDKDEPERIRTVSAILDYKPRRLPIRLGKIPPAQLVKLQEKNLRTDSPLYKTWSLWGDRLLKGINNSGSATVYSSETVDPKEFKPSLLAEAYLHVLGILLWRRIDDLNRYRAGLIADFTRELEEGKYLDRLSPDRSAPGFAARITSGELRPEEEELVQKNLARYREIEKESVERFRKQLGDLQFNLVISFRPGELMRELAGFLQDLETLAPEHRSFILASLARGLEAGQGSSLPVKRF